MAVCPSPPPERRRSRAAAALIAALAGALGTASALPPARAAMVTDAAFSSALRPSACERAGAAAERRFGLPAGLLLAIGRVESGRFDATRGRTVPWPFAVDVAGMGQDFDDAPTALARVRQALAGGERNIDVGCFQINLANHPDAFPALAQAFEPAANAFYAARFLATLRLRLGSWDRAVAAYHSATPALGAPYRAAVYAGWAASGGNPAAAARLIRLSAALPDGGPDDPVVVRGSRVPGMHVWGPSPSGLAPAHFAMPRADP
ncbi:MAG: transglycosylase SLT domain-containing protein [Rhodospirillales bacterium]|nr:transglycosylase SLT domain-containing protein [Rhodospirillales bacterium]